MIAFNRALAVIAWAAQFCPTCRDPRHREPRFGCLIRAPGIASLVTEHVLRSLVPSPLLRGMN
jgi:hypothetical protein